MTNTKPVSDSRKRPSASSASRTPHSSRSAFTLYNIEAFGQPEPPMCRNIKPLFNFDPPVTPEEVRAASLQFVRKITGFHKPSKANEAAFEAAIDEIARASARLLHSLETTAPHRNREAEADKARARAA